MFNTFANHHKQLFCVRLTNEGIDENYHLWVTADDFSLDEFETENILADEFE